MRRGAEGGAGEDLSLVKVDLVCLVRILGLGLLENSK